MTPSNLRQISRQLYSEPQTFASSRPTVRPSDYFGAYKVISMSAKSPLLAFVKDHSVTAWSNPDHSVTFVSPYTSPNGNGEEYLTVRDHREARIALGY